MFHPRNAWPPRFQYILLLSEIVPPCPPIHTLLFPAGRTVTPRCIPKRVRCQLPWMSHVPAVSPPPDPGLAGGVRLHYPPGLRRWPRPHARATRQLSAGPWWPRGHRTGDRSGQRVSPWQVHSLADAPQAGAGHMATSWLRRWRIRPWFFLEGDAGSRHTGVPGAASAARGELWFPVR